MKWDYESESNKFFKIRSKANNKKLGQAQGSTTSGIKVIKVLVKNLGI